MDWKKELDKLLKKGCSDSDIEDFVDEHPKINGRDIWDYVYEFDAPAGCHGCKHIQMRGMTPCNRCSRIIELTDCYEPR